MPYRVYSGPRGSELSPADKQHLLFKECGSLDDAFRDATAGMAQWLTDDYGLTPSELAQVLGTSAEYKVSEVADRNAGIVLKINKERLHALTPAKPKPE